MVSSNTLCKNILNIKDTVVTDTKFFDDQDRVNRVQISVRLSKSHEKAARIAIKSALHMAIKLIILVYEVDSLVDVIGYTQCIKCSVHDIVFTDIQGLSEKRISITILYF